MRTFISAIFATFVTTGCFAQDIRSYAGDLHIGEYNTDAFLEFVGDNEGQLVTLDIRLWLDAGVPRNLDIMSLCNPSLASFQKPFMETEIYLPISAGDDQWCSDIPIIFSDQHVSQHSAGTGLIWLQLSGKYIISKLSDQKLTWKIARAKNH